MFDRRALPGTLAGLGGLAFAVAAIVTQEPVLVILAAICTALCVVLVLTLPNRVPLRYKERKDLKEEAEKLVRDAHLLEDAGCFAIVLEKIPAALGTRVASELRIPIIGIGAGGGVDGQVLVIHDMLGINKGFSPRFLRRYADLHEVMTGAVTSYVEDVKSGDFPNESEQY